MTSCRKEENVNCEKKSNCGPLAKLKLGVNLNSVGEYGSEAHASWEIIDPIGPTFLWKIYSADIYLIHFKFETVKDILW